MILRRIAGSRFSVIERNWDGAMAVLIAGGPSLTRADVDLVGDAHAAGRVRVIAVNDAYLLAPWADVLYFADAHWWAWQTQGRPKIALNLAGEDVAKRFREFRGERCSISNARLNIKDEAVHILKNAVGNGHSFGLSRERTAIVTGRNSGFQALNIAILAGAARVLLLGYDGRAGVDGRSHWFGEHPTPTPAAIWGEIKKSFSEAERDIEALGVSVVNCSPGSAIASFPRSTIGAELA